MSEYKFSLKDFGNLNQNQWCPGCGNFGILTAVKQAIIELEINPKDVLIVSGIGCSSKFPHYINCYGIETLHGRAIPTAIGAKMSNPNLHVIVVGGDGDGFSIGIGHFLHGIRSDVNITYIVLDNEIYALTKGQTSPRTQNGIKTPTSLNGYNNQFCPLSFAIINGCRFVARSSSNNLSHMKEIIVQAISHKGFSFVDIMQSCVSYYKTRDFKWFSENISELDRNICPPENKFKVLEYLEKINSKSKIEIGVFYKKEVDFVEYKKTKVFDDLDNINIYNCLKEFE